MVRRVTSLGSWPQNSFSCETGTLRALNRGSPPSSLPSGHCRSTFSFYIFEWSKYLIPLEFSFQSLFAHWKYTLIWLTSFYWPYTLWSWKTQTNTLVLVAFFCKCLRFFTCRIVSSGNRKRFTSFPVWLPYFFYLPYCADTSVQCWSANTYSLVPSLRGRHSAFHCQV